ncbi:putative vacuolar protein sorting-associated protein TDA6 [Bienertia sinuspersici]
MISRTAGRLAGRAIGYVQLARGQFDNVMQQTQFRQDNPDSGGTTNARPLNVSGESTADGDNEVKHKQGQQDLPGFKVDASVFKEHGSVASGTSNLYSQATAYAKLAESPALNPGTMEGSVSMDTVDVRPGLLSVLPVSAESAGLLPNRHGMT